MTTEESHLAYKISLQSMIINLLLFVFKGLFGFLISSTSLICDAIHSLTDIFSTFVVLLGIKFSNKPADKSHPYGHEKIECIIAFLLGIMLFVIGGRIGWDGFQKLLHPVETLKQNLLLNTSAIIIAAISIGTKEWMYHFTIKCAQKINSSSMVADAWHHRTDALSSVGSLIGIIGIRLGYPAVDAIACLIISLFIFKAAFEICVDACKKVIDTSCSSEIISTIEEIININKEVLAIDVIKTRQYGSKIYVDLEITLNKDTSFVHSHNVAHSIHNEIEKNIAGVKHCMIHVNPSKLINHHHI
ncbi:MULTISPECIES: cation diffusion facilitator family transporter [unclassified Sedimentibacter]|uniref:cation diffusion facilitator family transporter n=1 Tax=unclassified Sedimentibacter TaxID=2649220 RepID=UPI0027DFBCEE|nr:cation diffusion facilitator family transporter [Sedimentibacter sp. MB35-C1]WMJ77085.1 cation diffusion facilitator family transporter [Sedimentibacter sp. MB35-C1]